MAKRSANPQDLFDGAMAALDGGDLKKAARLARKLSKVAPRAPDGWQLRALVASQAGAFEDAAAHLKRGLKLAPDDPVMLNNLGNAHRQAGNVDAARQAYTLSLQHRPGHVPTALNLGDVCMDLGMYDAAEGVFRTILADDPDDVEGLLGVAAALVKKEDFLPAREIYARLGGLGQDGIHVRQGRYQTALGLGLVDEAVTAAVAMRELAPDDPKYHYFTSILHLLRGDWRAGWDAYAARWQYQPETARPFEMPWWTGDALDGRRLLVWGDQGIGDEIMFAGLVPDIAGAGGVMLECDPRLTGLFGRSFPDAEIIARRTPPDSRTRDAELQIPSADLCRWYRAEAAQFGAGDAYLVPDPARALALRTAYREEFKVPGAAPLVGISWRSSNPEIGAGKSITLDDLAPVLGLEQARFFNLQYGDTAAERAAFEAQTGHRIHHDPEIDPLVDIDGQAAQVAAMDLVISISNSTVHLAGALGVPTWAIIKSVPDRRWMMDRTDSPFYASVRLFRQPEPGDWQSPISAVRDALAAWPGAAATD